MEGEGKLASNSNDEMRQILAEFMAGIVRFEELVVVGKTFLISFQQSLEFLRRPSISETSELVQNIIKENETKRVKSYVQGGCMNAYDSTQSISQLNKSLCGLRDCLTRAKGIINELENLLDKATNVLQIESSEQEVTPNDEEEICSSSPEGLDAAGCASFMAVIHSMVKQDDVMQERIVSSLSLRSSSGELESYCLMWSLRPFINDVIIHQAMRFVA